MVAGDHSRPGMARQLSNVFEPPAPKQTGRLSSLPGGRPALFAFGLSLVAYTLQTEAAQYVQQGLGYRKPFLSLYLGHSGFTILLPLHLLLLRYTTKLPYSHYLHIIAQNLHWQLSTPTRHVEGKVQEDIRRRLSVHSGRDGRTGYSDRADAAHDQDEEGQGLQSHPTSRPSMPRPISFRDSLHLSHPHLASSIPGPPPYKSAAQRAFGFDLPKLILMLLTLMGAITIPALSWYCAVPMTSMADITALYNTFSVWALVFSVWFFGEKWSRYKVTSVLLACGGVIVVAYGGGEEGEHRRRPKELDPVYGKPSATSAVSSVLATSTDSAGAARSPTQAVEARLAEIARRETGATKVQVLDYVPRTPAAANAVPRHTRAEASSPEESASNPLLGDLLALFGAITMAAYEMAFKLLGTLPDEEGQKKRWDRAQGGSSSSGGRRSRAGSRAGSRPTSRHQRVVSGEADDEDEDEEEERLLVGEEREEQSHGSKRYSKRGRGRKERDHVLGLSDDEAQEGGSLAIPKQSTERSAIWSPSGDGASPSAPDGGSARVPPDYGSGASSPFLSIENGGGAFGGSSKQRASSVEGSSSRRGSRGVVSDPLSVEAVKDRLRASDRKGAASGGAAGPRQSKARSALVTDEEEEDDATETETETESVFQSGDEEEILAGGTRLGRNRPLSRPGGGRSSGRGAGKRRTVLFDQDRPYKEDHVDDDDDDDDGDDEEQDPDETLRETRPSIREARHPVASTTAHGTNEQAWIPPPLPFGLHANIMTTGIGVVTAGTLWIGVLVAHLTGWEPFELPHNAVTVFAILFVVFSGVIFNACFMLLLALWGPVTASVSCLLSTVAVAIFDALLRGAFSIVSLLGCCFIVGGFGLLMLEGGGGH